MATPAQSQRKRLLLVQHKIAGLVTLRRCSLFRSDIRANIIGQIWDVIPVKSQDKVNDLVTIPVDNAIRWGIREDVHDQLRERA